MRFGRRTPPVDDHRRVLHEFSRSLALIVDEETLHDTITAQLRSGLALERVLLFLRDGDDTPYRLAAARGIDKAAAAGITFAPAGRLVRWLRVNEEPLLLDVSSGVVAFLDPADRAALERLGIAACVPLVSMNRLTGFLLIAPAQRTALWPTPAQRHLLLAMAGQAALGCENAALLAEQKTRHRRMYRAERLATAGELAAGAAHEIRNPLTAVRSAIQLIRADYPDGSDRHEMVGDILDEVDRIEEIVQGLLSFARREDPSFQTLDLAELVHHSVALVRPRARTQSVEVAIDTPASLHVQADPGLLRQVLLNIMLNALQAMDKGGTLRITAMAVGRQVQLRIADTGAGIAPEHLDRIFDPFFTTKKAGTGLGLSICYGIIERHAGRLEVESQPAVGTTIIITLPERQPA
jgi:two-component system, NtrC family, sensor kinase